MRKKIIAAILCVALILGSIPFVFSADGDSVYMADGNILYELKADADTSAVPAGFGAADGNSNGRVWTDKSVAVTNSGFNVKLSALAQEYIATNADITDSKIGVDVVMILDMSGSMKSNKLAVTDYDGTVETNATRTKAMTKALNEAIDTIMKANPNNRVTVCTYQAYAPAKYIELLPLDHYSNNSWTAEHPWQKGTTATTSNSGTGSGKYFNYNADKITVNTDMVASSGAAVASNEATANSSTPTQVGVINGVQGMINTLNSQEYDVERVPFVLLFTDGIPSVAKATFCFANTASGNVGTSVDKGSADYTAWTILASRYQKDQLYNAYSAYNQEHTGDSAYDVRWYNIGLGVDKSTDPAMGRAFMDPATVMDGSNKYANDVKKYINSAATGANAKYATDYVYCEGANHVYFAETSDALDGAFANLAKDIEITSKEPGKPVINLTIEGQSATKELTFTDVIGAGMSIDTSSMVLTNNGEDITATYNEESGRYEFDGFETYAVITEGTQQTLTWVIPPEEIALVTFSDRANYYDDNGNFGYEMADPIQLNYSVNKAEGDAEDKLYSNAFSGTTPGTTVSFAVLNDNPWFYNVELDANGSYVSSTPKTISADAKDENVTDTAPNYCEVENESFGDAGALITAGLGNNGVLVPTLKITKTVDDKDGKVTPGQEVVYTITVENLTDKDIEDPIILNDIIPNGYQTKNYTNSDDVHMMSAMSMMVVNIDSIPAGESVSGSYTLTVPATAQDGTEIPGKDPVYFSIGDTDVSDSYDDNPDLDLTVVAGGTYSVTYSWSGDVPAGVTLPTDSNEYEDGAAYTIDYTYTSASKVETKDSYGNVNGRYTFSGWDKSSGTIAGADVEAKGVWTYEEVEVPTANVTYIWDGDVPSGETLPADTKDYVVGESYKVETTYTAETVVVAKDSNNNETGRYTFSGWEDSGNGTMTADGATFSGTWTYEQAYKVTYQWTGPSPVAQVPSDNTAYYPGDKYSVDNVYTSTYQVPVLDPETNEVTAIYKFSGWTDPNNGEMGSDNVVITGVWTYEEITPEENNVIFTPVDPETPGTVTVNENDKIKVDPNGGEWTDPEGNTQTTVTEITVTDDIVINDPEKDGFTFTGWEVTEDDEGGITLTAQYKKKYAVTYVYEGETPTAEGTAAPTDSKVYYEGDTVDADAPATTTVIENGVKWTFDGWDADAKEITDEDIEFVGAWTKDPATKVTYDLSDVPDGFPSVTDDNDYYDGDTISTDKSVDEGKEFEVTDDEGNVTEKWTFQGWDVPDGKEVTENDGEEIIITPIWSKDAVTYNVIYKYEGEAPADAPTDSEDYVNGTTVTAVQPADTVIVENGIKWTFKGWDADSKKIKDADAEFIGTWTKDPATKVTYDLSDVPEDFPAVTDDNDYYDGDKVPTDKTVPVGKEFEVTDDEGNVIEKWTFQGWDVPDGKEVTEEDGEEIVITPIWAKEDVIFSVTYSWSGDIPDGVTLPTDDGEYVNGDAYTVDTIYTSATKIETKDAYGNVNGKYTFSGWDKADGNIAGKDVEIKGVWTYTEQDIDTNDVTFTPVDPSNPGTVPVPDNSKVKVDPNGGEWTDPEGNTQTTVTEITVSEDTEIEDATKDGYTFTGWEVTEDDEGEITLTAQYKKNYAVTYVYEGETPTAADTASPTDSKVYFEGDTVDADMPAATSSVENGVKWTFDGWDADAKEITDEDIEFVGTWSKDPATKVTYDLGDDVPDGFPTITDDNDYYDGDKIPTDKTVPEGTEFEITDDEGNVTEKWTFQGWDVPDGKEVTEDDGEEIVITPIWAKDGVTYNVIYKYEGEAPAAAPTDSENYVNGTTVTAVQPADTVIVENGIKWTFKGWDADSKKIKDADAEFIGTWTKDPATKVTYSPDGENIKDFPNVTDDKDYYDGDEVITSKDIPEGKEFEVTDDDGTVTEKWTFQGWDVPDGKEITEEDGEEIIIKPIWSKQSNYTVTYSWSGDVPATDAQGNYVAPSDNGTKLTAPVNDGRYFEGESYGLDNNYAVSPDTTVYEVKDEYGNVKGTYTFSGWADTNNGVMGTADMTLTGTWTYEDVDVPKGGITYQFTGSKVPTADNDGNELTVPVDDKVYTKGEDISVSDKYEGLTVNHYDQYGNVDGIYTFDGWVSDSTDNKMDDDGVVISGNWSYTDVEVPSHTVTIPDSIDTPDFEVTNNEKIIVDPNSGIWNHDGTDFDESVTITVTDDLEIADPEKEGYIFVEWTLTTTEGVKTLVAQWEKDTKTVIFTPDDPDKPGKEETPTGSTITVDPSDGEWTYGGETYVDPTEITVDEDIDLPDPERDGYTFTGWETETDDDGNITFIATWEEDSKPITPTTPADYLIPAAAVIIPAATIGGVTAAIIGGAITTAIVAGSIAAVPLAIVTAVVAKKVIDKADADTPDNGDNTVDDNSSVEIPHTGSNSTIAIVAVVLLLLAAVAIIVVIVTKKKKK